MKSSTISTAFKRTFLFGFVQILQILVTLIRAKVVVILLGSEGVGLTNIFSSSTYFLITFAGLSCYFSAVRTFAQIKDNHEAVLEELRTNNYLFLLLGLFAALVMILLSSIMSKVTFGSDDYVLSFLILSSYIFFYIYQQGLLSILQGLQFVMAIAACNIIPNILMLAISIPLYIFLRNDAIIYVLTILPIFIMFVCIFFLGKKYGLSFFKIPDWKKVFIRLKEYVRSGVFLTISSTFTYVVAYLINLYLVKTASVEMVGYYQAGYGIIAQYVSIIFVTIAADYYPRLSAELKNPEGFDDVVNSQSILLILLSTPMFCMLMLFTPLIIYVLLSSEFLVIKNFLIITSFAYVFKTALFGFSYVPMAKSNQFVYFSLESSSNLILLIASCLLYKSFGLTGLALAYLIAYGIQFLLNVAVSLIKYRIKIEKTFVSYMLISLVFSLLMMFSAIKNYIWICIPLLLCVCILYYKKLDKYLNLTQYIKNKFIRK